jgi:hypothetical protein
MFAAEIGRALKDKLKAWLFEPTGGWYKASALTSENSAAFARKARSILQEMNLSMRLEEAGIAFLPYRFTRREHLMIKIKTRVDRLRRSFKVA